MELEKRNPSLLLVLALATGIADLAGFLGAKNQNLAQPVVGVNPGRQRSGIRDLDGRESLPFRLEWHCVHSDSATRIGRLSNADCRYILGLRKYPMDRADADQFGGTITELAQTDTNKRS